jgi:hypothetical protein
MSARALGYIKFTRPVELPELGFQLELNAGTEVHVGRDPRNPRVAVPVVFRDLETNDFVIGKRRIPVQAGLVECYEFAAAVKVAKK